MSLWNMKNLNLKSLGPRLKKFIFKNIVFILALGILAYFKGPDILKNWERQGSFFSRTQTVQDIHGNTLELTPPYAFVFWATYCGPCKVELGRINSLVEKNKIPREKIIAVSIDEQKEVLLNEAPKRGYQFPIIWDLENQPSLNKKFEVTGTPTIIVIGKDSKVEWVTMGISPLLELRLNYYLD